MRKFLTSFCVFVLTSVVSAVQILISDPRVSGDTLVVPCVVAELSGATTLSLRLGAAAPKDGERSDNFTSLNMMKLENNTLNLSFAEGQSA